MTTHETARITLDATTHVIAKPAKNGWKVVAVEDGHERTLGGSNVVGARRAIHEVLRQRNRAMTRQAPVRDSATRPNARGAARRPVPAAPIAPPAAMNDDDQPAAWAALRRAVAQTHTTAAKPSQAAQRRESARQAPPTTRPTPVATTRDGETAAATASASAVTPPVNGPVWGVHVTLEQLADDTAPSAMTGTAVGEISPALSGALRDALGDRAGGRVRKALRRHGLITRPAVFEHEQRGRGRTQRLRIHVTHIDTAAGFEGDVAAVICERTRHLPVHRDVALLGA